MYCAMKANCLVLLCVSSLTLISADNKVPRRSKRIIDGIPVTARDSPYNVVRYTVFIARPESCSKGLLDYWPYFLAINRYINGSWNAKYPCHPDPNDLRCGGSLLTPRFVHTACHCVADFVSRPGTNKSYAVIRDVYEHDRKIFAGQADTFNMFHFVEPKKYFAYEQCAKLKRGELLHDFGIITLQRELNWPIYQELEINYVPTPPVNKIKELYYKVLNEQSTCLLVGWGLHRLTARGEFERVASRFLLHGWRTITSYNTCKHFQFSKSKEEKYRETHPDFDYIRDSTDACTLPVVNKTSRFGSLHSSGDGDSGMPVTCHNQYFAVVSGAKNIRNQNFPGNVILHVGLVSPVAFSYYEVAHEYRKEFAEKVWWWGEVDATSIHVTRPPHEEFRGGSLSITNPTSLSLLSIIFVIIPLSY